MGYFNEASKEQIKTAIQTAEHQTSGEIRVCVEKKCKTNPVDRAGHFFRKLKMDQTEQRNGVLIYLASDDRKFSIIGDSGIHSKTGPLFWEDSRDIMQEHFKAGKITEGVVAAILLVGMSMKKFFPYQADDKNELPDDVYEAD